MSVAGVFLIQGLEGSRFGAPTLWVLNGWADGEGRDEGELDSRGPGSPSSREDFPQPLSQEAGDAGTRVAMVFVVMS
jgi:hypothetical protein